MLCAASFRGDSGGVLRSQTGVEVSRKQEIQLSSMCIYLLPNITTMSKVKVCSMVVRLLPDPKDPVVGEGDIEIVAPALSEERREGRREEEREGGKEGRREGREGGRKRGKEGRREGGKEGGRKEGGKEGGKEGRKEGRKGGRKRGKEGRREEGRTERKKEGRREREKREGKEKKADDIMLN